MDENFNYMLSTSDNPFNPYTDWDQWYAYDVAHGYHTSAYIARVVVTSPEISEADQELALNDAINEIIELNLTGNYIKVYEPGTSPPTTETEAVAS